MRRLRTQTLLALLLSAAATGAQTAPPKETKKDATPTPPKPEIAIIAPPVTPATMGKLEGGVYTNDFFGISFRVPDGWVVHDEAARGAIMQVGKELVEEGASDRKKQLLEASTDRTQFLLSVSKYAPGKAGPGFNALILCLAERVPTAIVKTGADYIALVQRTMQGTSAKVELSGPVRTQRLGNGDFTVADVKLTAGPVITAQRYYVTITKGHALVLAYTYLDESDLKTFDEFIRSVRYK